MLSDDLSKLLSGKDRVIAEMVVNLERELLVANPKKTGNLQSAWTTDQLSDGSWVLSNDTEYADVIFNGRRQVPTKLGNMKWVGSIQMPDGIYPRIQKFSKELQKRLDLLKV